jgi:hypothetical protein
MAIIEQQLIWGQRSSLRPTLSRLQAFNVETSPSVVADDATVQCGGWQGVVVEMLDRFIIPRCCTREQRSRTLQSGVFVAQRFSQPVTLDALRPSIV